METNFALEFLAVFFVGVAPFIMGSLIYSRWPKAQISAHIAVELASKLVVSLGAIFVILLVVSYHPHGAAYIGFDLHNKDMISKVLFWGPFTFFTTIIILVYVSKRSQSVSKD